MHEELGNDYLFDRLSPILPAPTTPKLHLDGT
jgi:hypothetical protein